MYFLLNSDISIQVLNATENKDNVKFLNSPTPLKFNTIQYEVNKAFVVVIGLLEWVPILKCNS